MRVHCTYRNGGHKVRKLKIFNEVLPEVRLFKCKEAELSSNYLLEDLTMKEIADYMGFGCISDPEEATVMSETTGLPIVGNSVWVKCPSKLEVGTVYEGHLRKKETSGLPELKLEN